MPVAIELVRQPPRALDHLRGIVAAADAGEHRLARAPYRLHRFGLAPRAHVVIDAFGGAAQRKLAQRDQIALAEKMARGVARLLGQIDPALLEPPQQLVGRQVHQHDLVGAIEHRVGHGFPDPDAGDAADRLVQAVQVLDVDGGPDIDAGGTQLLDVLPALGVAAAQRIRMRQLVDQDQRGSARQRAVEVELLQHAAAIGHVAHRQPFQAGQQRLGLGAAMRFHHADRHIGALRQGRPGGGQHREGLADAGRGAEIHAQLAARGTLTLLLDHPQQRIGIGARTGIAQFGFGHRQWNRTGLRQNKRKAILPRHPRHYFGPGSPSESSARFSRSTLTPASPSTPSAGRSVLAAISSRTCCNVRPRARATRAA